jgi:hypothetical protein
MKLTIDESNWLRILSNSGIVVVPLDRILPLKLLEAKGLVKALSYTKAPHFTITPAGKMIVETFDKKCLSITFGDETKTLNLTNIPTSDDGGGEETTE